MRHFRLGRILSSEEGFSLIELMGVAVIMIILTVMALPVYAEVSDKARTARSSEEIRLIGDMLEAYYAEKGQYPGSLSILVGHSLKPTSLESPWSNPPENLVYYYYAVDKVATHYFLGAPGPGVICSSGSRDDRCGTDPKIGAHNLEMNPDGTPAYPSLKFVSIRTSR